MSTGPYVGVPPRIPDRPLWRPRRTRRLANDTAVAVVLAGFLVVAAAVSLYGTGGMPDDVQGCPSLAAADTLPAQLRLSCSPWREDRAQYIRELSLVGVVVAALGLLTAGRRWWDLGEDRPAAWTVVARSLLTPVAYVVFMTPTLPPGQANDGIYTALGQILVAGAVFVTWRCASWRREPGLRAHLLMASALAVPLVCAGTAFVEAYRWRSPARPFRVQEADFPFGSGAFTPALIAGGATAALFAVAVLLTRWSRRPPNVWLGAVLFVVSVAATVAVFVPDLVPAWENVDAYGWDSPGPAVWLPVLLAPAGVTVLVWAASAMRRATHEPDPALR